MQAMSARTGKLVKKIGVGLGDRIGGGIGDRIGGGLE